MQDTSSGTLCVCEMCKCGDHRCPQQNEKELLKNVRQDFGMDVNQQQPAHERQRRRSACQAYGQIPESNLYSSSTYREDFQVGQDIAGPPEPSKLVGTIKCETGKIEKSSTYTWDFVPSSVEDTKLCNSVLNQNRNSTPGEVRTQSKKSFDISELKPEAIQRLHKYYCPPHCLGNEKQLPARNCLIDFKDKFNLGPPTKKATAPIEKPSTSFSKVTNYLLDYIPHKIEPRQNSTTRKQTPIEPPILCDNTTTHKEDYVCWSPDDYTRRGRESPRTTAADEKQPSTLRAGVCGPMVTQSTSMTDYKDPNVTARISVRPSRDVFRPPLCRMETQTTTGASFPRWRDVSGQPRSKPVEGTNQAATSSDTRCFVTTYQQDFDDLREVLCPAKVIQKYGRKILEPKYRYVGSGNEHEYYRCEAERA